MQSDLKSMAHPIWAGFKSYPDFDYINVRQLRFFLGFGTWDFEFGRWISSDGSASDRFFTDHGKYAEFHSCGIVSGLASSPGHIVHAISIGEVLWAGDFPVMEIFAEVPPDIGNPLPGQRFIGVTRLDVIGYPRVPKIALRAPCVLGQARLIAFGSGLAGMCRNVVRKRPERFTTPFAVPALKLQEPVRGFRIAVQ